MKLNEEGMRQFRAKLEEEFKNLLDNGEDIRCYLYFPHEYLTENIKRHLDEFLMEQAYKEIELENVTPNAFTVYKDSLITVKLEKKVQQVELLERLLNYFEKNQEFEKCAKVQRLLKQIPN